MTETCPTCGAPWPGPVPPEPPIGTTVVDRFGAESTRQRVRTEFPRGNYFWEEGWAPIGCVPGGRWEDMWKARGPLTIKEET